MLEKPTKTDSDAETDTEADLGTTVNAQRRTAALAAQAVVFEQPGKAVLKDLELTQPGETDLVVDVLYSGISTGTERLLFDGEMPAFPGMGYPLVPGYEALGTISNAGNSTTHAAGDLVFVPGAHCYSDMRSLFGGASSKLVVPAERTFSVDTSLGDKGLLLALAATAHHILHVDGTQTIPDLIVGHGVLGRLLARLVCVLAPQAELMVWEDNAARRSGAVGYSVTDPEQDDCNTYRCIVDVSGDSNIIDALVMRLAPAKQLAAVPLIILGGFYKESLSFKFAPAFMREARFQIAAEWTPDDMQAVCLLANSGKLSLDGLITHRETSTRAQQAYNTAFNDASCLKMILDWREHGNV